MKYKPILYILVLWVLLTASVCGAQAKPFVIGVIEDCPSSRSADLLAEIKAEVRSLTKSEFDVKFDKTRHIVARCNPQSIQSGVEKLLSDNRVDLVMALGHMGSYFLCKKKDLAKPSIGGLVLSTDIQGIPFYKGKSGQKNLVYIAFSTDFKQTIETLKQVVPFKKPVYLFDKNLQTMLPRNKTGFAKLSQAIGMDMKFIPVGDFAQPALNNIDNKFDAVFLGDLTKLADNEIDKIILHLKKRKLPGFSIYGQNMVAKGLLAGFNHSSTEKRYVRRMGLLVQQILLKEKPEDIFVAFSKDDKLIINMQTAKAIGISPSFSILAEAEVINRHNNILPARSLEFAVPDDTLKILAPQSAPPTKDSGVKPQSNKIQINISPRLSQDKIDSEQNSFMAAGTDRDSLTLLDAINLTLERNPGLKSKAKEVAAGRMDIRTALAKFYPRLDTGISGRVIDKDRTSAISGVAQRAWDITGRVTQLVYSDLANTDLKTSRHSQKVLELSENQARLDAVLETGIAYINALKARANASIQLENLKLIRSNLNLASNRYRAGFSGPSDVYRLESEAANAYKAYLDALAKVAASKIHLHRILYLDLEQESSITDLGLDDGLFLISNTRTRQALDIDNSDSLKRVRNFYVQKGIEQSPELQSIDQQIMAQQTIYEYAKRSYWSPDIKLVGDLGNTFAKNGEGSDFPQIPSSLGSAFQEPDDTYWSVGLNLTLPLYKGGAKKALKIKSLETNHQLVFLRTQIKNQISENIRLSLLAIGASYPAIELTKISSSSAGKNLELVVDNYTKGTMSIVELLDAQNAFLNAKILAENAVYDFFMDFITTERATGQYSILMTAQEKENWIQEYRRFK